MSPTSHARRSRLHFTLILLLLACGAAVLLAAGLVFDPAGTLVASDGDTDHLFGSELAVDGDEAVVGAPGWRDTEYSYLGAAYVFARSGITWTELTRLTDANRLSGETFGSAVALEGDLLAVGAPGIHQTEPVFLEDAGGVVTFRRQGTDWVQGQTLMPDDLLAFNDFGRSVDLNGETLIVGAPAWYGTRANEAAYVYMWNGTAWALEQKLQAPGSPAQFGRAVSIHGNTALVGAPGIPCCDSSDLEDSGAVYVFTRSGATWTPAGTLTPVETSNGDLFGCEIDFDGNTAVIAACEAYGLTPSDHGEAYVFVFDGANWTQQATLNPDVEDKGTELDSVALEGDRLVLGAYRAFRPGPGFNSTGAAFVYERSGDTWTYVQTLYAPAGQDADSFGVAVALSGPSVLVGAPYDSVLNVDDQGSVSVFHAIAPGTQRVYLPVTIGRPSPPVPPGSLDSDSLQHP